MKKIKEPKWHDYPEYMPPESGQYEVKWSNGNVGVQQYHNGFITIDEIRRNPPYNELPEVYIIAWKIIVY